MSLRSLGADFSIKLVIGRIKEVEYFLDTLVTFVFRNNNVLPSAEYVISTIHIELLKDILFLGLFDREIRCRELADYLRSRGSRLNWQFRL